MRKRSAVTLLRPLPGGGVRLSERTSARIRLGLIVALLTTLAIAASVILRDEMRATVARELSLVLAAHVEVARALLGRADEPRGDTDLARALERLSTFSHFGRTGEAYAFDASGVMLSRSRFAREPHARRWVAQVDGRERVLLRDPGGPLPDGHQPELARRAQPLTRMARAAIAGESGLDVDGYRDYRGVEVVGAWTWLPAYGLGLAFEIDRNEAYALHDGLFSVLTLLYFACIVAMVIAGRSDRAVQRARSEAAAARQLGQYTLIREIGRGGMGVVYEARHAHLRRRTAVKVMRPPADASLRTEAMLRFEREVQLTSQLSHPNTIIIYDYGQDEEGQFFYAMEYVDGVDLERIVRLGGPLHVGRLIFIATQICGSLAEAHDHSLIHRDIKPANVLVCERGGVLDSVKVLDFGLVKSLLAPQVSAANVLVGTPQYMAPETLRDPTRADARSDIYSLGALLYWLATGHVPFENVPLLEAVDARRGERLRLPSSLRPDLPVDIERIILRCMARDPFERPSTMAELARELRACRDCGTWTPEDARRYWREQGALLKPDQVAAPEVPTVVAT